MEMEAPFDGLLARVISSYQVPDPRYFEWTSGSRVRPTPSLFHLETTSLVVVLESELFKSLHDTRQKIKST